MAEELKTREGPPLTGRRLKGYILGGIHLPVRSRWGKWEEPVRQAGAGWGCQLAGATSVGKPGGVIGVRLAGFQEWLHIW